MLSPTCLLALRFWIYLESLDLNCLFVIYCLYHVTDVEAGQWFLVCKVVVFGSI